MLRATLAAVRSVQLPSGRNDKKLLTARGFNELCNRSRIFVTLE